jgi:hypothetical protein
MRCATVRLLRHVLKDSEISPIYWKYHLHYLLFRIFDYPKEKMNEKRQLIEVFKELLKRRSDVEKIPVMMIRGIISVCETQEDLYQHVSCEICRELLIKTPLTFSKAGGIKTLLNALADPRFSDIFDSIVTSILYCIDNQQTRKYINTYDLSTLFACFTQPHLQKDPLIMGQWDTAKNVFSQMMRGWAGLIYLSQENFGISSLANALKIDDSRDRHVF